MTGALGKMTAKVDDSSLHLIESAADFFDSEEDEKVTVFQCCRSGDSLTLEILLSDRRKQTTINDLDDNGLSALHYAAREKHFEAARLLLEKGKAYAAVKDEDGATPLHYCARKRQKTPSRECTDLVHMLAYLTDVNVRDRYLSTPLHFAAMRANEVVAEALLECTGVDLNAKDILGCTPLHEAAAYNDTQVALLLIKYGADIDAVDNNGRTPLHLAVMGEETTKMIKLLLQNINKDQAVKLINRPDKDHNTALHLAIDARNGPAVRILLKKGSHVNNPCRTSSSGSTPLHLAAITGDTQIIELLLSHRAKIVAKDLQGSTPLHKAVEYQNGAAVELLVKKLRQTPTQTDLEGYTPLLVGACYSDADIVQSLLDARSDLTSVDRQDRNALHLAAFNDATSIMKVLIQHAIDSEKENLLNEEDHQAESPLHIASRLGYTQVAQLLIDAGADLTIKNEDEETAFLLAAKTGNAELVEMFILTSNKVLNDQDEYSNSALHLAAAGGHLPVVEILVRAGADKTMRNVRLDTPMDYASLEGHAEVVKFLLDEEVSPNDQDDNKETPLLLASRNGHEDVVSILIERGADVTNCDKRGRNCLSLAIDKGHREVALAIVQSSHWEQALLHEMDHHGRVRDTPMRKLIRTMPDVAQVVLNRCITSSPEDVHPSDLNFWYRFNFMFLDDSFFDYDPITVKNMKPRLDASDPELDKMRLYDKAPSYTTSKIELLNNHPLMVMVDSKRDDLLSHPLVLGLIRHKWNVCRPAYFGYMLFYAIFLSILTAFMLVAKAPYIPAGVCSTTVQPPPSVQGNFEKVGKYFIIVFATLGVISEVVQVVTEKSLYMIQPLNLLDWFTYISAFLVVIDIEPCQARSAWQWQLGAFCVFATWINFLLLMRRIPMLGIYTVMIQDILKTFFKFFGVFLLFLMAFSFTFFILLETQDTFKGPGVSIVKTWTMLLGEFTFDDIFFPQTNVKYTGVTYVIFVIFLVVMAIVVVNLMTGLAVDDVNELQRHAQLRKLAIQIELAITMEISMPEVMRRALEFTVCGLVVFPNIQHSQVARFFNRVIDGAILDKSHIVERVRGLEGERPSETALLEQKIDRFLSTRKYNIQTINTRLDKIEGMLEKLLASQTGTSRRRRRTSQQLPP